MDAPNPEAALYVILYLKKKLKGEIGVKNAKQMTRRMRNFWTHEVVLGCKQQTLCFVNSFQSRTPMRGGPAVRGFRRHTRVVKDTGSSICAHKLFPRALVWLQRIQESPGRFPEPLSLEGGMSERSRGPHPDSSLLSHRDIPGQQRQQDSWSGGMKNVVSTPVRCPGSQVQ